MTKLLPDYLCSIATQTPERLAVKWPDGQLTYGEIYTKASNVAAALINAGAAPGKLTAVALSAGEDRILAIYALMLAGNAWLPVDVTYPKARIDHMITDSGVCHAIVDTQSTLQFSANVNVHPIDALEEYQTQQYLGCSPDDLAYVIYTSGSTGKPKGVEILHRSIAVTASGMAKAFGIGEDDRVLQFSSASFDASIAEIGIALVMSAALVVGPRTTLIPGEGMARFMEQNAVTVAILPPSVLAEMPRTQGALPNLRTLICAGEALPESLVRHWVQGRRMINAYGPTEAAICATAIDVTDLAEGDQPSIGTALPGVTVTVVDEQLQPVADGERGELLIGGAGVARGYINLPDLTDTRFVTGPDGGRVYRTGDMVCRRPDGGLAFAGRIDDQIKLSGFRIEPGEIAEVIRRHPDVSDAAVDVRDNNIVAWFRGIADASLRDWCAQELPSHMVPKFFINIAHMPLTPAGKLDRAALPDPVHHVSVADAPVGDLEIQVAAIFCDLLCLTSVSRYDSFFALGGNSLSVGRLAARIRAEMDADVSLVDLFDAPEVQAIARRIAEPGAIGDDRGLPPALPALVKGPKGHAPLSFPQERIWFLERFSTGNLAYQAQAILRLQGPLDVEALHSTLSELVSRHESLRTAFVEEDGIPVQRPVADMVIELPVVDLSALPAPTRAAEAQAFIDKTIRETIEIIQAPLVRWHLIRTSPQDHTLLHIEHHLIHDGWSFGVLMKELITIYERRISGNTAPLPAPAFRFTDYARWQRDWLQGDVLDRFIQYWTDRLKGTPPALFLPTDRPRPPVFSFAGDAVKVTFTESEYAALRAGTAAMDSTLYSVMMAAFSALMGRYADQEDFVVGAGVANRRLAETENLVGMAINSLPLRMDLTGGPVFADLVRQVQTTAAEAMSWGDVPLDRLVDALALPRDPAYNPLFSVMFSFHDAQVPYLRFGGLEGDIVVQHNGSAKSDLNVVVIPQAEQQIGQEGESKDATLSIIWEYATDLFDHSTIEAMVSDYRALIKQVLADPEVSVDSIPLPSKMTWQKPERTITINGFRIAPADVETAVLSHPAIGDVAVVHAVAGQAQECLVAYVACHSQADRVSEDDLRAYLATRLPRISVPNRFVILPKLQRDANGHLDVESLPFLDLAATPETPQTEMEQQVLPIILKLLGCHSLGRNTDFFVAGGRSLLAVQLLASIERELGLIVSLADFLKNPTLAGLAQVAAKPTRPVPKRLMASKRRLQSLAASQNQTNQHKS